MFLRIVQRYSIFLRRSSQKSEIVGDYGDPDLIDEFARRAYMRLLYVPMKDSQFRRNRERVNKDAENEGVSVEWFPEEVNN